MCQVNILPAAHGYFDWLVSGQVLYGRLVGDMTTSLLTALNTRALGFAAEATPRLALLLDVSEVTHLPPMREMPRLNMLGSMKSRWIITLDTQARSGHHPYCVTWNVLGTLYQFQSRPFGAPALALDALQTLHRQMPELTPLYEAALERMHQRQTEQDLAHFVLGD